MLPWIIIIIDNKNNYNSILTCYQELFKKLLDLGVSIDEILLRVWI